MICPVKDCLYCTYRRKNPEAAMIRHLSVYHDTNQLIQALIYLMKAREGKPEGK